MFSSCGHNLIAMAGVGVAIAAKAAMQKHGIPGKIILLGTPGKLLQYSDGLRGLTISTFS